MGSATAVSGMPSPQSAPQRRHPGEQLMNATPSSDPVLEILRHNVGFTEPEQWRDYAVRHGFRRVDAVPVPRCPDCGGEPRETIGQYVYYSTLIHLRRCGDCGLIWADAHLAPDVVASHFESAYKDRDYFRMARAAVFRQLVDEVDRAAPRGGTVLDIGGAQGDLMDLVRRRRPDLTAIVNDLSTSATRFAVEHYGLSAIPGDFLAVRSRGRRFDVVVLSDVLYYEPRLAEFWRVLPELLTPNGTVVIRVPNKLHLIRAHEALERLADRRGQRVRAEVKQFNPEHLYILDRRYLESRLRRLGFAKVAFLPSPPVVDPRSLPKRMLAGALYRLADVASRVSGGALVVTPSMVLTATRAG
jgi:SAM-dependent methyltransferase